MAPHTETSLKALTVPKLKADTRQNVYLLPCCIQDLLTAASLSTVGKKDELIARLLEANIEDGSYTSSEPEAVAAATKTTTTAEAATAVTENGSATAAASTPVAALTETSSTDAVAAAAPATALAPAATPAVPEPTAEEKAERLRLEQEKRAARAARFGVVDNGATDATASIDEVAQAKEQRAKRFGLPQEGEKEKQDKLDKSLSALGRPLGEKRAREPQAPKTAAAAAAAAPNTTAAAPNTTAAAPNTTAAAPNTTAAAPAKAAAPANKEKEVDPELAAKIAQEEERKRKRAERFGAPAPVEKKAKTTA
ncbi:BQ2448_1487 [Microbotryum intermedium]|uniref:BQ2448_1487 protein n=1 Tax=Microbotryum intermedium TaxID=269621 RepID=A0A238FDJ9_9BASI|nr:BQ2448_1487 [Microbotryum intermedium]